MSCNVTRQNVVLILLSSEKLYGFILTLIEVYILSQNC